MCVNLRITFTTVKHDLICPRVLIGSNKVNNNNNNNNNNNFLGYSYKTNYIEKLKLKGQILN